MVCSCGKSGSCRMICTASASSKAARRRRMECMRVRTDQPVVKRRRLEACEDVGCCLHRRNGEVPPNHVLVADGAVGRGADLPPPLIVSRPRPYARDGGHLALVPKYGFNSVCGRRRDMEDAVAIHPWFCRSSGGEQQHGSGVASSWSPDRVALHYFGVYDGHGCSHVAMKCRERLHQLVKEEIMVSGHNNVVSNYWKCVMERSFTRMDKEVMGWNELLHAEGTPVSCRCELQSPECDTVGSTAVVAVLTPHSIVVANCGDSRAVLCRNGKPIPLSDDHKPDRPDELRRIQAAGGRVIFWEGARVLGVLAMSRAIGDNYLKPYVSCEPEVTITDRTVQDEFLILASDGLWDVVSNVTACGIVRDCLRAPPPSHDGNKDAACNDAAVLLTKLALARRSADNVSVVIIDLRKKKRSYYNDATCSSNR